MRAIAQVSLFILTFFSLGACMPSPPLSYYTSPQSTGYNEQALGGICERCGRQFQFSANQLNNVPNITCPYCQHSQDTKQASLRWVNLKSRQEQINNQALANAIVKGVAQGVNKNNSTYNTTNSSASSCSSDYGCGYGQKCVKAPYESTGVCMKTVNQFGVQEYGTPDSSSIGVNTGNKSCNFDTDCPVGFKCDSKYKACVK
jgi:hypothetical protein